MTNIAKFVRKVKKLDGENTFNILLTVIVIV